MQANVGPTWAPGRRVSARPAENRSMSLGASYRVENLAHKCGEISSGGELHEHAFGMPHISL